MLWITPASSAQKSKDEKLERELFWLYLVLFKAWAFGTKHLDFALSDFLPCSQSPSSPLARICIMVFFPIQSPHCFCFVLFGCCCCCFVFFLMRAGAIYLKILEAKMNPALKNSQGSATGGPSVCRRQRVSKQMLLLLQQCAWILGNVFSL